MRIYEGSPRQDWEEVLRSVGAYLDDRGMRGIVFVETDTGFIIQGTAPKTVLVRARGPSMIPFGVANALANPRLQLFLGQAQLVAHRAGATVALSG